MFICLHPQTNFSADPARKYVQLVDPDGIEEATNGESRNRQKCAQIKLYLQTLRFENHKFHLIIISSQISQPCKNSGGD